MAHWKALSKGFPMVPGSGRVPGVFRLNGRPMAHWKALLEGFPTVPGAGCVGGSCAGCVSVEWATEAGACVPYQQITRPGHSNSRSLKRVGGIRTFRHAGSGWCTCRRVLPDPSGRLPHVGRCPRRGGGERCPNRRRARRRVRHRGSGCDASAKSPRIRVACAGRVCSCDNDRGNVLKLTGCTRGRLALGESEEV
eukprot:scaffold28288_cov127-Isochrysis_galbana.AAC.2